MKWLFAIILATLAAFAVCCGIGYFLPSSQIVESYVSVDSYPDEIYAELSDLRGYPAWFQGLDVVDETQIIFAGAERGAGQTAAWRLEQGNDTAQFGNLEILQAQTDSRVTLQYEQGAQTIAMTYAVQDDNDAVLLLARYETALGDFPYLSRVRGKLSEGKITQELDMSLQRLKGLIEITTTQ